MARLGQGLSITVGRRIAVIGGGFAGLAAAVELASRNVAVTLFESARDLGGRARRVDYRGHALDNGQHLMLGAYRETLRLMQLVGANPDHLQRRPLELAIPGKFSLRTPRLPAPLHLFFGLVSARGLSLGERLAAARFMRAQQRQQFRLPDDITVAELLRRHGQVGNLGRYLWEPLCTAALNTPPAIASAQVFLNVLRDSLNAAREDSDMLLPMADASRLFPDHVAPFLTRHGGEVLTACKVTAVKRHGAGFEVNSAAGQQQFERVICAVPPQRLAPFLTDFPELAPVADQVEQFRYQPIYSLYLQYPEHVRLPAPLLGLDGCGQWVFDLGQMGRPRGLLAVVISAEGAHDNLGREQLSAQVQQELRCAFGDLPEPLWDKIILDRRATFSCTPNLARPEQATAVRHFYLAGDYTAGDYPATLEGAVRSGVKCARLILENP